MWQSLAPIVYLMSGVLVPTGRKEDFEQAEKLIDGDGVDIIPIQDHTHSKFGDLFICFTSVFAVDLQLSGLCIYWIGVLNSILEQSKIATRRNSISSPLQGSGNDPKGSEDSTKVDIESVSIGTKEFSKTMKSVMHSGGDEASRKEEAAWKKKEKLSYNKFTRRIVEDMKENYVVCKTYPYLAFALTNCTFGIGQIASPYARNIWFHVAKKYYFFMLSVFGIWTKSTYKCFRFSDPRGESKDKITDDDEDLSVFGIWTDLTYKCSRFSPSSESKDKITDDDADNRTSFSDEMSATIVTRALVLMLVPQLAVVSMYAVATAGCPLLVFSKDCRGRLPPPFVDNALEISMERVEKEMNKEGEKRSVRELKQYWVAYVKSYRIYLQLSRVIQYFISLFQYIVSYGLVYGNAKVWVLVSMIFLFPYIIVSSLDVVVFIGKCFQMTDDDFKGIKSFIEFSWNEWKSWSNSFFA